MHVKKGRESMKRKVGDFTLTEIKNLCEGHSTCEHCPLLDVCLKAEYVSFDDLLVDATLLEVEVEI